VIWAQELYTRDEGLVVRQGSGVHALRDLENRSLALVVGSTSSFEVATALADAGIPASSVHIVNMSPPAMVAAWERGQLDAAYVWDPAFDTMLHDHGYAIMYDQNVARQAPIFNLAVVQGPWARTHRQLVLGFIEAEQAGVAYYKSHPDQAIRDMAKEAGISVALARTELEGYRIYSLRDQLGPKGLGQGAGIRSALVTVSLSASAKYLSSIHQISISPSDMSAYVDPSYAQAALAQP
jgi:NitT/TauT family transport system substrate-binding protein/taurine transport system substrate-binding protein